MVGVVGIRHTVAAEDPIRRPCISRAQFPLPKLIANCNFCIPDSNLAAGADGFDIRYMEAEAAAVVVVAADLDNHHTAVVARALLVVCIHSSAEA